ncbi:MAG: hypothetical protein WC755_08970 [Candidatus Woesearchaeota archaeon]|jgi:hypothetical protein
MTLPSWIIKKYVLLSNLEGLKQNGKKYNARCPICGDSKVNKTKKRFWVLDEHGKYPNMCVCFNCGYSKPFDFFIKTQREHLWQDFKKDLLSNNLKLYKKRQLEYHDEEVKVEKIEIDALSLLDKALNNQDAVDYCTYRKLPEEFIKTLYYSDNYMKFLNDNAIKSFQFIPESDKRIIIPYFSVNKKLTHIQGRTIEDHDIRYMTATILEEPKVWNIENVDFTKDVFVFEGVLDACYFPNTIATGGLLSSMEYLLSNFDSSKLVIVPDGDYRINSKVRDQVMKFVDKKLRVSLIPKFVKQKDINDMILHGMAVSEAFDIINNNIYEGIEAKTRIMLHRYK